MSVRRVRIGDVLEYRRTPVVVDSEGRYRQVGVRGFGRGIFEYDPVAGSELGSLRYFTLEPDRLVVSNIKGWEGAVAVTSGAEQGRVASNRFLTYATRGSACVSYLAHWLLSDAGLQALGRASPGSADRNRTLSIKNFEAIEVPLPDLAKQRRIADHLDRVEDRAQMLMMASSQLSATRDALVDQEFSGSTVPCSPLGQILTPQFGEVVDASTVYPIAGVYSFGRGLLYRESIRGSETKYATLTRLTAGDVVYSKLGAFEGAVAIVDQNSDGRYVSPEFPVFSRSELTDADYLRFCLTSRSFADRLQAVSTGVGARQKRVHPSTFLALALPLPDLDAQRRVACRLAKADKASQLTNRRVRIAAALLPAARNEVFSAMR